MSAVLLVAAVVLSLIAALLGFGVVSGSHALGWLAAGAACGWASFLVGHVPWRGGA